VPPLPTSTTLHVARLILAGKVAGISQQQPTREHQGVAGTSAKAILVLLPKSKYAIPTKLVDDPMLTSWVLKHFEDIFKELYKFSTVCLLGLSGHTLLTNLLA
jgi:hypothetical protein